MSKFAVLGSPGFSSSYGGFETLVRHLAPSLVAAGHNVVVYGRDSERTKVINGVEMRSTRGLESKSTSTLSYGLTASLDLVRRGRLSLGASCMAC